MSRLLLPLLLLGLWLPAVTPAHLVIPEDSGLKALSDTGGRILKKRSSPDVGASDIDVYSVKVDCKVTSRFAHNVITSRAVNRGNVSHEVLFDMELPKTAFITNFSMVIDGVTYLGQVKEKEQAKQQYQKAVSQGQTAGLVKASGRKMEKFSVSVNIAAASKVTFQLTYEELLQRHMGQYEMMIRVRPKQLLQHFEIVVDVFEPQGIAFLNAHGTFISNELLPLVEKTVSENTAHVSFSPTMEKQRSCVGCPSTLIDGDFFITYDVKRERDAGEIQIMNGYFVHHFAPSDLPRVRKNVVFVIDESGSMYGTKMRQTREALDAILSEIHMDDYFALLVFDHGFRTWRPSLSPATPKNIAEAKEFVKGINARGATNINQAVLESVRMLEQDKAAGQLPDHSVSIIILLTDGEPVSGETNPERIRENVLNAIGGNMTLYCLGFGYDVKLAFLEKMAAENNGVARRIYEDSDAAIQLQGFYNEVANPLLSDIELQYPENAVDSLTDNTFKQLYNGSEIVVAGHISDNDLDNFLVEVKAQGAVQELQLQAQASVQDSEKVFRNQSYIFGEFTERLWAYLTIQQLLRKRGSGSPEERANKTARALELSLKYSFVTPLTSMVVTKPPKDNRDDLMLADKLTEDQRVPPPPVQQSFAYRYSSLPPVSSVDSDPHFIVQPPNQNDTLCFNIDESPGVIFNLVRDPQTGTVVNGQTIADKHLDPSGRVGTYFWRFGIVSQSLGLRLDVSTQGIELLHGQSRLELSWDESLTLKQTNFDLQMDKERSLTVSLKDSVKFVVILHKVWSKHPTHRDYLGFYTLDSHLLSPATHGLLGQFYHGLSFQVSELRSGETSDKPDATMLVKGQHLTVTRGWQKDFRTDVKNGQEVACWFVHNNGTGLIDGTHRDYIVSGIFKTS
ncbi:inter-alpha-trypsin inhibitor heavy chain H3 [Amia ocellicauda]|uniref:inter-alpha-trypsin inhibitor heavy chain H3 n=1 Tax=Amia ocellicauda TaxID=2972642 RepID=UPI003463E873